MFGNSKSTINRRYSNGFLEGTASSCEPYLGDRILTAVHGTHSGNIALLKVGPNADFIGSGFVNNANERGGHGFFGSTTPGSAELAEDFAQHVTEDATECGGLSARIEPAYVGVYMEAAQFENALRSGKIRKQYINEHFPPNSHHVSTVRNAEWGEEVCFRPAVYKHMELRPVDDPYNEHTSTLRRTLSEPVGFPRPDIRLHPEENRRIMNMYLKRKQEGKPF